MLKSGESPEPVGPRSVERVQRSFLRSAGGIVPKHLVGSYSGNFKDPFPRESRGCEVLGEKKID